MTETDLAEIRAFRHDLHRHPEVSGAESKTAARVLAHLAPTRPDHVLTGLGGHGVALAYDMAAPGPTVMIRAELDALPITELSEAPHASSLPGTGHLCGHDGHMAILAATARLIRRHPPARGRVLLLFQPAEETGAGAAAVLADLAFGGVAPDWALSLHNMPGLPRGAALLAEGPANCASMGLRLSFGGKTAHAAQPETGLSPATALARLIPALTALGPGGAMGPDFRLVTITHARLGEPAFGIAPGEAELWATLRSRDDGPMAALLAEATALAQAAAEADGLTLEISHHDVFAACANHPQATAVLEGAAQATGLALRTDGLPFRASEDFGRFAALCPSAMLFLGAGEGHPALHNPDYDFPDALIAEGAALFDHAIRQILD
ncbi:amidohydrolase [Tabrizicola sp. DMG-N-6]|uniref:Amidohydrolase n=1 Tax=Szabonella alba TaxID=2804194 RepID=A0A8K0VB58_9RHOB|nr:amidohydrolase [Szabonella alba]